MPPCARTPALTHTRVTVTAGVPGWGCGNGLSPAPQVNVDGEPMHDTRFRFEVLPKRLRLHVPEPKLLEEAGTPASQRGKQAPHAATDKVPHSPGLALWVLRQVMTPE